MLEVKVIEGLGTTIDVVLVNGVLHEGDQIVVCGLNGAIATSIRSLLTPHPLKVGFHHWFPVGVTQLCVLGNLGIEHCHQRRTLCHDVRGVERESE